MTKKKILFIELTNFYFSNQRKRTPFSKQNPVYLYNIYIQNIRDVWNQVESRIMLREKGRKSTDAEFAFLKTKASPPPPTHTHLFWICFFWKVDRIEQWRMTSCDSASRTRELSIHSACSFSFLFISQVFRSSLGASATLFQVHCCLVFCFKAPKRRERERKRKKNLLLFSKRRIPRRRRLLITLENNSSTIIY